MGRWFVREVAGRLIDIHVSEESLALSVDLDVETSGVASMMGLLAQLLAEAVEKQGRLDAEYRHWRACKMKNLAELAAQPGGNKKPEYVMSAEVESDNGFLERKNALAKMEADVQYLRAYLEALKVKSFLVQTKANLAKVALLA
ncbi:MAG: hypothetical protein UY96_C0010G0043 [Parcubacteria group bacterium GW2011_GWB1_56_8]|nr:MAG: hypothetical protein UY96_C0010G0043 [Parcubacteria group bacterium GW2011_GWB1_56_8]